MKKSSSATTILESLPKKNVCIICDEEYEACTSSTDQSYDVTSPMSLTEREEQAESCASSAEHEVVPADLAELEHAELATDSADETESLSDLAEQAEFAANSAQQKKLLASLARMSI